MREKLDRQNNNGNVWERERSNCGGNEREREVRKNNRSIIEKITVKLKRKIREKKK